jgi:hypothetical protein
VFFVVFILITAVIFVNLLIAVILTLSVKSLNLEESATRRYKLKNLVMLWSKYDPKGQGFINYKVFFQFSMAMAMECGIDKVYFKNILRHCSTILKKSGCSCVSLIFQFTSIVILANIAIFFTMLL